MFDPKFSETCKRRFTERDLAFKKAIQSVFEEMNARGILTSGITAMRVQEIVQEELKASGDEILCVLKDVHAVYGRKTKMETVKFRSHELLQQRLREIDSFKVEQLSRILGSLANQSILSAIDSQDQIARVEAEFDLQVDRYFHDLDQASFRSNFKKIWQDPVWSKVIASVILSIGGIIWLWLSHKTNINKSKLPLEDMSSVSLTTLKTGTNKPQPSNVAADKKKNLTRIPSHITKDTNIPLLLTELDHKGLYNDLEAAESFLATQTENSIVAALERYDNVIRSLSPSARAQLDRTLLEGAKSDVNGKHLDDAAAKYRALFSGALEQKRHY